jgi:ubiquinone/menaquinone biosynthesis C-methylase UbiE
MQARHSSGPQLTATVEKRVPIMKKKMSNFAFQMMTNVGMPVRNLFMPPAKMLAEVEINPGYKVLDYGCGPGAFAIMIAEIIGQSGIVYALDIHPLAIKAAEQKARKKNLSNIKTILSSCSTFLPDNSLDLVIFFDVFHTLNNQEEVLIELHRILKSDAIMCFSDHHMKEIEILKRLTEKGLFKLKSKGIRTFALSKV